MAKVKEITNNLEVDWDYRGVTDERIQGRLTSNDIRIMFKIKDVIRVSGTCEGILINVSGAGMRIASPQFLKRGEKIDISFDIKEHKFSCSGKIVYTHKMNTDEPIVYVYGIEFTDISDYQSEKIKGLFKEKKLHYKEH